MSSNTSGCYIILQNICGGGFSGFRITEGNNIRITESGDTRVTE